MSRRRSIVRGVALVIGVAGAACNLVTGASDLVAPADVEVDGAAPEAPPPQVEVDGANVPPPMPDGRPPEVDEEDAEPPKEETDSGTDAPPPPLEASTDAGFLRVFLTSTTTPGALGGVAQGDAFCQGLANSAALGGTWKAWLGVTGAPPSQRIVGSGPWRLLNGTVVANDRAQLLGGSLANTISRNEKNLAMSGHIHVWSGASAPGTTAPDTCANWTSAAAQGLLGYNTAGAGWTDHLSRPCGTDNRLYCFEQ